MINEVLAAIHPLLPERVFILLPNNTEPDLVVFTDKYKATIHYDNNLPVFVIVNRSDGRLVTWGEGVTIADAAQQAMNMLSQSQESRGKAA